MTISFSVTVKNKGGLEVRESAMLVKYAILNGLDMAIIYEGKEASAYSMLEVIGLCVPQGAVIDIEVAQDERGACGVMSVDEVMHDVKNLFDVAFVA